jgi:hypothetical protein
VLLVAVLIDAAHPPLKHREVALNGVAVDDALAFVADVLGDQLGDVLFVRLSMWKVRTMPPRSTRPRMGRYTKPGLRVL